MSDNRISRRVFSGGILGAALAAPTLLRAQQAQALKVRLDWTSWGAHGAMHLAQTKGWLAKAGLAVEVQDGTGSAATVQMIGSSSEFDIGYAQLSAMMVAKSKGLDVKAFASIVRQGDIGCLVPKSSGIKSTADLKGKKIIYSAGGLEAPFIDSFLAAGGLKRSDVDMVSVSPAAKAATYGAGEADAVMSAIPFILPAVDDLRPSNTIRFADSKLEMPGFGLIAQVATLKGPKREALSRYASIIAATWSYIYAGHQEEAIDACIAQRPQARLNRKVLRAQIDLQQQFMETPAGKGLPLGEIALADWDIGVKTLSAVNLVSGSIKAADYVETGLVKPFDLASAK